MIRRSSAHSKFPLLLPLPLSVPRRRTAFALLLIAISFISRGAIAQGVRINEIMYAPGISEPQWIELSKADSAVVDIAGWSIVSQAGTTTLPTNLLTADSFRRYIVLTADSAGLRAKRPGTYLIIQCPLPQLGTSGDALVLEDASRRTIDSVAFRLSWGGMPGVSLERISLTASSNDSANWGSSIAPVGATPGAENSLSFPAVRDLGLDSLAYTLSGDSLYLSLRIENRGNRRLDTSNLLITADSGTGASTFYSGTVAPLDADSAVTLHLSVLFAAYRPITYSVFVVNPQDTIHNDDTLRFTVPGRTQPLSVVLNEIMFAPISPEPEWIELWNTSMDTVDVSGWTITVQGHAATTIPDSNSILAPDSMVIVSSNPAQLSLRRNIPSQRIISVGLPALVNTGDEIALRDAVGTLIDSVAYAGTSKKGISIERIDPGKLGYDTSNWAPCLDSSGSTILRPNSQRKRTRDLALLSAAYWNDSLLILLRNNGSDTILDPEIGLRIDTIDTIHYSTAASILPDSVAQFLFPLPNNFFGLLTASAFLEDSLDEQHANDTAWVALHRPIPSHSLVVNEIMFGPADTSCQWFEVYNRSSSFISLDSVRLVTGEKRPSEYVHAIKPLTVGPLSYGVVAADSTKFYAVYPWLRQEHGLLALGISTLDLGRDSCFMVLRNRDSSMLDSVHYFKSWQQSLVRKTFAGVSLERIDPSGSSNTADNWHASLDSSGATPLAINSSSGSQSHDTVVPSGSTFSATFDPNPFSPEYDPSRSTSTLTIQTGDPGVSGRTPNLWLLRVRMYDPQGRMVRLLTDAEQIMGGTLLAFDGRDDNGEYLRPGVYAALIELTSQNPVRTLRKTVGIVIARKRE